MDGCELCGRDKELTFHHLIPRINHSKNTFQKLFSRNEMITRGIAVCRDCHSTIHRLIDNKSLGLVYNTREKLLEHEGVARFVQWVKKQAKRVKKK